MGSELPKTDTPLKLSKMQIQEIYLEIQSRIGILLSAESITEEAKKSLKSVSATMLKTKRCWIGVMDEIKR